MAVIRVEEFDGIPLYYDRYKADSYGVSARPMRPYIDQQFSKTCVDLFQELRAVLNAAGLNIVQIWSGGVGRSGSGNSYHHKNRAFDLDALIFEDGSKWVAKTFPEQPFLYLAIEAILRRHFGTVLSYDFNRAHEDHFHFDNGTVVGFKRSARSHVLFLQHCLVKLFNQDIGSSGADGVYGGDTETALNRVRRELSIGGLSEKENWLSFLTTCADTALEMEHGIVTVGQKGILS